MRMLLYWCCYLYAHWGDSDCDDEVQISGETGGKYCTCTVE